LAKSVFVSVSIGLEISTCKKDLKGKSSECMTDRQGKAQQHQLSAQMQAPSCHALH
jgi:hypothetical protein